jgi:hypothetical protein
MDVRNLAMVQVKLWTRNAKYVSGIRQGQKVSTPVTEQKNSGTPHAFNNCSVANIVRDLPLQGKKLTDLYYFARDGKFAIVATFSANGVAIDDSPIKELAMMAWDGFTWVNPNNTVTINCARRSSAGGTALEFTLPE